MFSKSFISTLCILIICDPFTRLHLVVAGGGSGFFAGNQDGDKKLKSFESSFGGGGGGGGRGRGKSKGEGRTPPKYSHSAGLKAFDELAWVVYPLGDKYSGGLPDSPAAMAKHCAEFIPKGLAVVAYSQVRYPHKMILKAMIVLQAIGILKTIGVYCSNPITALAFMGMAKIVNEANDELFKIKEEFAIRSLNSLTKIDNPDEKQRHICCAYVDYKRKSYDAVGDDARDFVRTLIDGFFIMEQRLFCQQYQDDVYERECSKLEYIDDDPDYPPTRAIFTAPMLVVAEFM